LPQTQHSICKLPVIARIVRRRAELEKTLGPDRLDAAVSAQNSARRAGTIALARITLQETPLGYCTETDTTPAPIMPSARAALTDTSMILPRMNGPRSLTRHWIERPDRVVTVTTLPIGLVR
jgi:hypothetical protein